MGGILIFLMGGEEVRWRFCYAEVEVWGAAHLVLFVLWEMMSNRGIFERGVGRKAKVEVGVGGAAHFVFFFVRAAARS